MKAKSLIVFACALAAGGTPANAAFDLVGWLNAAKGGESITLPAGNYGTVTFPKKAYASPVTIDATSARFTALIMQNLSNLTIKGGKVTGTGGKSYGVNVRFAKRVAVTNMTITGAHRGIVVGDSQDVSVKGNILTGLISDGINVAQSQRVRVESNSCSNFNPTPATYDAAGKLLVDGDHPDCIQSWSRPGFVVADLVIVGNLATGDMQGIFLGNHVRNGVSDGGFDRVSIRNNRVTVSAPNGIRIDDGRDSVITGNVVNTVAGAKMGNFPFRPVKANLTVMRPVRSVVCGNAIQLLDSAVERACTSAEAARQ